MLLNSNRCNYEKLYSYIFHFNVTALQRQNLLDPHPVGIVLCTVLATISWEGAILSYQIQFDRQLILDETDGISHSDRISH